MAVALILAGYHCTPRMLRLGAMICLTSEAGSCITTALSRRTFACVASTVPFATYHSLMLASNTDFNVTGYFIAWPPVAKVRLACGSH